MQTATIYRTSQPLQTQNTQPALKRTGFTAPISSQSSSVAKPQFSGLGELVAIAVGGGIFLYLLNGTIQFLKILGNKNFRNGMDELSQGNFGNADNLFNKADEELNSKKKKK